MSRHPIAAGPGQPWEFAPGYFACMWQDDITPDGPHVVIDDPAGERMIIPRSTLAVLGRGLLAAHVDGSRPEWRGKT